MKTRNLVCWFFLVYLLFAGRLWPVSARAATASLDALQKVYTVQQAKIQQQLRKGMEPHRNGYYQGLMKYMEHIKSTGKLKALVAVKAEEERLLKEKTVPAVPAQGLDPIIARLQRQYNRSITSLKNAADRQRLSLMARYLKRLEALKKEFVAEENVKDGLLVQEELDTVLADYQALKQSGDSKAANGLVLHYGFDATDSRAVKDKSPSGNHGRLTNARWILSGVTGGGCMLSGTDSRVVSTEAVPVTGAGPRTIAFWFMLDRFERRNSLFGLGQFQPAGMNLITMFNPHHIYLHQHNADLAFTASSMADKRWHHLVLTYDGTAARCYLDGLLRTVQKVPMDTKAGPACLGSVREIYDHHHGDSFMGGVDELMIWTRALGDEEISALYKLQGKGLPPPKSVKAPSLKPQAPMRIPPEAKTHNGHHYMVFNERLSWAEAHDHCRKLGGYLATIQSLEETRFLGPLVTDVPLWLGGTEMESEGDWRWDTGEPFIFNYWEPGEPNNSGGNETRMVLLKDGWWGDRPEHNRWPFICEWNR